MSLSLRNVASPRPTVSLHLEARTLVVPRYRTLVAALRSSKLKRVQAIVAPLKLYSVNPVYTPSCVLIYRYTNTVRQQRHESRISCCSTPLHRPLIPSPGLSSRCLRRRCHGGSHRLCHLRCRGRRRRGSWSRSYPGARPHGLSPRLLPRHSRWQLGGTAIPMQFLGIHRMRIRLLRELRRWPIPLHPLRRRRSHTAGRTVRAVWWLQLLTIPRNLVPLRHRRPP